MNNKPTHPTICANCQFVNATNPPTCLKTKTQHLNFVTGATTHNYKPCEAINTDGRCGWFQERREPFESTRSERTNLGEFGKLAEPEVLCELREYVLCEEIIRPSTVMLLAEYFLHSYDAIQADLPHILDNK